MLGQERFSQYNALFSRILVEKKHLIAVHRGSWGGNLIQNTVPAYIAAVKMGADMVESDVNRSTDGEFFSFHDGNEPNLWGIEKSVKKMSAKEIDAVRPLNTTKTPSRFSPSRLSEVLDFLPENILLNIDRAWDIFPSLLPYIDNFEKAKTHVLLKAPPREKAAYEALSNHPVKYPFMAICNTIEEIEESLSYPDINLVGIETNAKDENDPMFADSLISDLHRRNLFVWVNAIVVDDQHPLYAGLDDDISVICDPALGWGRLMDKHIDILQTDWPALLYQYRATRI